MSIKHRKKISPLKLLMALVVFYATTAGFVYLVMKFNSSKMSMASTRKPASIEGHHHDTKPHASFDIDMFSSEDEVKKGDEFTLNVVIHPTITAFNAVFECGIPENVRILEGLTSQYVNLETDKELTIELRLQQLDNENAQIHCGVNTYQGSTKLGASGQFNTLLQNHIDQVLEDKRVQHEFLRQQGFEKQIQQ